MLRTIIGVGLVSGALLTGWSPSWNEAPAPIPHPGPGPTVPPKPSDPVPLPPDPKPVLPPHPANTPHAYLMADPATDPQNTVSGKSGFDRETGTAQDRSWSGSGFSNPKTGTLSQFVRGSTCHPQTR